MSEAKKVMAVEEISEANAPAIYVAGGLQQFLDAVKAEVVAEVPDLTTKKGRDRIASLAAKVSKSKVAAVMGAAKEAIMAAGITEEQAREVVKLIAAGKVPHTAISF